MWLHVTSCDLMQLHGTFVTAMWPYVTAMTHHVTVMWPYVTVMWLLWVMWHVTAESRDCMWHHVTSWISTCSHIMLEINLHAYTHLPLAYSPPSSGNVFTRGGDGYLWLWEWLRLRGRPPLFQNAHHCKHVQLIHCCTVIINGVWVPGGSQKFLHNLP